MQRSFKIDKRLAFSLIELSVVILVIGILVIGITQGSRIMNEAKLKSARALTASSPVAATSGLVMWLESTSEKSFDTGVGNGGLVQNWYDTNPQSNTKYNATQSTSTKRPTYTKNAINGLPAILFDGIQDTTNGDFMDLTDSLVTDPRNWTTFVVFKNISGTGLVIGATSGYRYYISRGATSFNFQVGDGGSTSMLVTSNDPGIVILNSSNGVYTGTAVTNKTSGSNTSTPSPSTALLTGLNIGSYSDGTNSFFNGYVAEVIMFNRPLKMAEQNGIRDYLASKWGL
jgi:prepilin-type N-terminal cleavage/methylation domain-containing protein